MAASASSTAPLAVLDPALGRTGAHNRGFAEMMAARAGTPLAFWCSRAISDEYRASLATRGVEAIPAFGLDFYGLTHAPGGIAAHWDWIHRFALDYLTSLRQVAARWPGTPVRVLHHTLSWEHASALAIALRMLGEAGCHLEHVGLLMYSPGVSADGATLDPARQLDFRLAFSALDCMQNVSLYASCSEYAAAYARLLDKAASLPVHACFLGDWRERTERAAGASSGDVLAYVGEIKQEKGFLELPGRLAEMLREPALACRRLVVQVTESRTPAASEVMDRLQSMAVAEERIEVHVGYWSDEQLHRRLSRASALCLDYDARAYAYKTSGLLWLAAWHGLPVRVPAQGWLDREARRLGTPRIAPEKPPAPEFARRDASAFDAAYFRTIFTPFDTWITTTPVRSATPRALPMPDVDTARVGEAIADAQAQRSDDPLTRSGEGADVVLFWKQNDSTLYGRRNDMVARYLASRADVRRVVMVDAPISDTRLAALASGDGIDQARWIHARTLDKLRGACDSGKIAHHVFVYPAAVFGMSGHEAAEPAFIAAYAAFLQGVFDREGIDPARSMFWIYPRDYCMPALRQRFGPARTVVDIVDDHRAWPGVPAADRVRLGANYRELLTGADLVLANCQSVRAAMREFRDDIELVPNGCDVHSTVPDAAAEHPVLEEIDAHEGKVIGFVGNLEAKIDIALLEDVARAFPQHLLVFVGSTHANPRVRTLLQHPNVRLAGVVPYDRLGRWLPRFDVGLIPHLDMELTRHMNPLKSYVYLSWGVPVVSTAVANVEADGELVRMAVSNQAFIHQVEAALTMPPDPRRFREYATANDWRARLEPHVDTLAPGKVS